MVEDGAVKKHVVIIGAGAGGASLAARLAHRGYRVTVVEKVQGRRKFMNRRIRMKG